MQNRTVEADTCLNKTQLFFAATAFDWQCSHFLPSFIRFLPVTMAPSALLCLHGEFLLRTSSGPVIPWPRASAVYISLMDSHSNLPEQTHPSCPAEPLENPSLRQFQARLSFQTQFFGMFPFSNLWVWIKLEASLCWLEIYALAFFRWGTPSYSAWNLSGDELQGITGFESITKDNIVNNFFIRGNRRFPFLKGFVGGGWVVWSYYIMI